METPSASFLTEAQRQAEVVKSILESAAWYEDDAAIAILEEFVMTQMQCPTVYDVDANLAVLKHYLFFPRKAKVTTIRHILIQALMHLPSTDFDLCLCQVSLQHQQNDPVIRALIGAESLLQTCRFPVFWKQLSSDPDLTGLTEVPDFKDAIRRFMAGVISLTYHMLTMEDAGGLLQLEPQTGLPQFCAEQLQNRWVCDVKTGVVTVITKAPATSPAAVSPVGSSSINGGKQALAHGAALAGRSSLLAGSTLSDCLNAVSRGIPASSAAFRGACH